MNKFTLNFSNKKIENKYRIEYSIIYSDYFKKFHIAFIVMCIITFTLEIIK